MEPTNPKFCEACGKPLASGARFCEACGQAVAVEPAPPPVAPKAPASISTPPSKADTPTKAVLTAISVLLLCALGFFFSSAGKQLLSRFAGSQPTASLSSQPAESQPPQTVAPAPPNPASPAPGSIERQEICDALRAYVRKGRIKPEEIPFLFKVEFLRVDGDYAGFEGFPVNMDGSSLPPEATGDVVFTTFLKRTNGEWTVVADLTRTDVPDEEETKEIRKNFPADFPSSVLPDFWQKLLRP